MLDHEKEHVNCNLCNSDNHRNLYNINDLGIVKCKNCGLMYTNPRLTKRSLFNIYQDEYYVNPKFYDKSGKFIYGYADYLKDKEDIQASFKRVFERMGHFKKPGKLLEIGCAMGFFMEMAKEKGWETHGFEVSDFACEHAKNILGLNVRNSEFNGNEFPPNHFDAVTLFDVIEHLQDPLVELSKYRSALKSDGLLVLSTLNADSLVAKFLGKRWEEVRRNQVHLYIFSKRTISAILEKAGFKVLDVHQYGKYFSLESISERFLVYGRKRSRLAKFLFNSLKIGHWRFHVIPFTKIVVYAQKVEQ